MRVLRRFDWRDLAATAETSHSTVKQFLWGLKKAGLVLHRRSPYGPGIYVLLNDLGPHCPVVCTDAIYDPNHQAWIEYNQGAPE